MSLGDLMLQRIAEALERLVALKEQEAKRAIEQGLRPMPLFPYWDANGKFTYNGNTKQENT